MRDLPINNVLAQRPLFLFGISLPPGQILFNQYCLYDQYINFPPCFCCLVFSTYSILLFKQLLQNMNGRTSSVFSHGIQDCLGSNTVGPEEQLTQAQSLFFLSYGSPQFQVANLSCSLNLTYTISFLLSEQLQNTPIWKENQVLTAKCLM